MTTLTIIVSIILVPTLFAGFLFWYNHKKEERYFKKKNNDFNNDIRNLN